MDLTVSLIQANLYWEEIDANLAMFEEMVWEIDNTDLIVLPEMFTTGFSMNPKSLAEPPGGKSFKWMRQIAKQKNAAITGSYIIKENNHFFNRLYFVFPDGSSQQYDKKHLFTLAGEGNAYQPGTQKLIVDYKDWKIQPMICYDLRFPVWARSNSIPDKLYEYDLLVYVANWPDARIHAWDTLLQARAIENIAYCVGVNRIGLDGSQKQYPGHSAAYSYKGESLSIAKETREIQTITFSKDQLEEFRGRFPFQTDADPFTLD